MLRRLKDEAARRLSVARRVYVIDMLWRAYRDFSRDHGTMYAAAMSYYVLFSLFPLLIFVVSIFGLAVRDPALQERVVDAIVAQVPEDVDLRNQIERTVSGISQTSSGLLGLIGLLGTAWTASAMFGALRRALNNAFDVPGARSFIHAKGMDLLSVLGVMAMVLLSIAATTALGVVRAVANQLFTGVLINLAWGLVYFFLPFVLSTLVFLAVYRLVPNVTLPFRQLLIGAVIAAVGFEAAKSGFGLYVANFGRYQEVYGALGGVVAFLFFVFVVSNIVIFAAEVSSELTKDRRAEATQRAGAARADRPVRRGGPAEAGGGQR